MLLYGKMVKQWIFQKLNEFMKLFEYQDVDLFYGKSNLVPYAFVWEKVI